MEFCFLSKEIVAKMFLANKGIICFEGWCNIYLKYRFLCSSNFGYLKCLFFIADLVVYKAYPNK
jgi:hypothetical protein